MWHEVISDPRKNMLLSLHNASKSQESEQLTINTQNELENKKQNIEIDYVPEKASIIAIKDFKEYTENESKYLLVEDS